jgi:hypothetical protein
MTEICFERHDRDMHRATTAGRSFHFGHTRVLQDIPTSFVSDHSPPSHIHHRNDIEVVFRWIDGIGNARNGKFQVSVGQTAREQDFPSFWVIPLDLPTSFVSDHSPPSHIHHRNDIEAVFRWIDGIGNARNGKFQVSAGQTAWEQDFPSFWVIP